MKMHYLYVDARLFAAAALAVSTKETRYNLQGVYVEPDAAGGVRMVATNGPFMVVVRAPDAVMVGEPAIVPLPKALQKAASVTRVRRSGPAPMLTVESGRMSVDSVSTPYAPIDGTFPDYRQAVPSNFDTPVASWKADGKSGPRYGGAAFNADYLGAFAKIGELLCAGYGVDGGKTIALTVWDAESPALVQWGAEVPAFGIIMPVRVAPWGGRHTPAWFRVETPKAAPSEPAKQAV